MDLYSSWHNKLGNLLDLIGSFTITPKTSQTFIEMPKEILRVIAIWLEAEACVLFRRNEDGKFYLWTHYGLTQDLANKIDARRARSKDDDTSAITSEGGHTFVLEDLTADRRFSDLYPDHQSRSFVNIPIRSTKGIQYTIAMISKPGKKISVEMIPMLDIVGKQISIVFENAMNLQQVWSQSALEERTRLAREIHDELAQMVGLAHMQVMIAIDFLSKGRLEETRNELNELERTLEKLYINTREDLFNLRTYLETGRNFIPTLQEYLNDYSRYYHLNTRLKIDDLRATQIPDGVGFQVEWIIKEALANARKHSEAKNAEILFRAEPEQTAIIISDDGKGFNLNDLDPSNKQHSGLQVMQERAQMINGRLEIDSQPGSGTRVILYIPAVSET